MQKSLQVRKQSEVLELIISFVSYKDHYHCLSMTIGYVK